VIGISFTPDPNGAYLLETKLGQPVAATDDAIIRLAAEIPPDATFPTGSVGGAGMLVPARYEGGDLVSVYSPGQSIDLPTAIGNYARQLNGETVSDPYVFSPNTRRYLVQDGALIGWQTIMLGPSEFSLAPSTSLVMAPNGDNPQFYDGSTLPSLGSWWGDAYSGVSNFFTGDAPLWQKIAVGGVASVGIIAASVIALKACAAAGALAVTAGMLSAAGMLVKTAIATALTYVTATSLTYAYNEFGSGYTNARKQNGAVPDSMMGRVGYGFGKVATAAEVTGGAIRTVTTTVGEEYNKAIALLSQKSAELGRRLDQYTSWFGAARPWLIGGGVLALGLLAYSAFYGRR
jgi:hypothetical protein